MVFVCCGCGGEWIEWVVLMVVMFCYGESCLVEYVDGVIFVDLNLYIYCVVFNFVIWIDGLVGVFYLIVFCDWKMIVGVVYYVVLVVGVMEVGFNVDCFGKNGMFEIFGVVDDVV